MLAGFMAASLSSVVLEDKGSHQMMMTASHNSLMKSCSGFVMLDNAGFVAASLSNVVVLRTKGVTR